MSEFNRIDTTANRLREAMNAAGKRQIDLCRETDVTKGALSCYLKGSYEPKWDTIMELAQALNVNEMWLWGYDCAKERTDFHKKSDAVVGIVAKLKRDEDFYNAVEALYNMEPEKLRSLLHFLK